MDAFRVLIRGKFDGLDDAGRAALAAKGGDLMFSEAGTFTYDVNATAFTFRCQVPAGPDDDEKTAKARATTALRAHGLPCRDLNYAVTDLRAMRVRRKKR
ncbi:DUF6204 family protein [Amycolatopsis jiangsuensis]|uniref:Uncharacterized protein n=1 Tax=Amycolatopsis jiangsuensis TaxID=1181879 RepID=A0A840IT62_9PSEU|nr:DUF6204 family protein [Amycolatopsis jiangsuensis]MBB4685821.1 hypothetical protein [Amycolatopsis jiangsuensis]